MKNIFAKFLCKIGLHDWQPIFTGSLLNPCGDKCKRKDCKLVRQFNGWGYSFGYDVNDLPPHVKPPSENIINP